MKYRVTITVGERVRSVELFGKEAAINLYNWKRAYYKKHGFTCADAGGSGEALCELWVKDGSTDRNIEIYPVNA